MNTNRTIEAPVKPPTAEADDQALLSAIAGGDERAFEQFVDRFQRRVAGLAHRLLGYGEGAEDVAQEVFITVLGKAASFRGQASVWTWLCVITVNRTRTWQRRAWLFTQASKLLWRSEATESESTATSLARADSAERVRAAVKRLPAKQREVVVLRYLEELTIVEIGEALGLKRNTVEARLSRARRLLADELKNEDL